MREVTMKNLKYIFIAVFLYAFSKNCNSQNTLSGKVFEISEKGDTTALTGATLFWLHTNIATTSDVNGSYSLKKTNESNKLVISFVGYKNDTAGIDTAQVNADFILSNATTLKEVVVIYHGKASE